ncbi:MAG: hypothetical protein KAG97_09785 [Victivallales bacterium]|nr:hypothetical protein [Victivallales bacterium]
MSNIPPPLPDEGNVNREAETEYRSGEGWGWLAGCFALGGVLLAALITFGGYLAYNAYHELSNVFDDQSSVKTFIPSDADKERLKNKMETLKKAQKEGGQCCVELDSSDINTFIADASNDDSKDSARFAVKIENDLIRGKLSVPVKKDGAMKYINCDAVVSVSIDKGRLDVRLKDVLLKGKQPPMGLRLILVSFKHQNLAQQINTDLQHRELREKLRHCKKMSVENGRILLDLDFPKPKKRGGGGAGDVGNGKMERRGRGNVKY